MKANLPPGWKIIRTDPANWPHEEMRKKLGYAHGPSRKLYLRAKGWTTLPIVSGLILKHELTHAVQYEVCSGMFHSDDFVKYPEKLRDKVKLVWQYRDDVCGIMAQRGTVAWVLSPLVSLLRWDWHDKHSRELLQEYDSVENS